MLFTHRFVVVVCCRTFSAAGFLRTLAETVDENLTEAGLSHWSLKLTALPENEELTLTLSSDGAFTAPGAADAAELPVILELRFEGSAETAELAAGRALDTVCPRYNLTVFTYNKEFTET